MRWEKSNSASSNEIYHLWHNDKKLLTLTLHPFSNAARVEAPNEQRVFLIRKEGFFRNKTVLRNEYGIKVGELGLENENRFIDVNNERFYYQVEESPIAQMILYREKKEDPVVICGLNVRDGNASVQFEYDKSLISQTGLLMALCWYMFMPSAKELNVEPAV
jgi:hypothetical protein